jgi:iron(III) transport system ATP-binding protein
MVAGLEAVSSGRVLIGGEDVTLRAASERNVSMVFQSYALFPHMTVLENVCYGPISMRAGKAQARELAQRKLAMLGLSGFESRLPSELSGGQQQRVAVARSLVLEPAVLLFDEPLSNLDAKLRRRVREEIRELQLALNLTVLYVTHDQEEALAVSDRVIVMDGGRIAQQGTPQELYEAPRTRFLADFIGDANLVDGELAAGEDGPAFVAGGVSVPVGTGASSPGPATLAVRPHHVRVVPAGQGLFDGVCKRVAYLGSRVEYVVATPWGELLAFDGNVRRRHGRDEPVGVAFGRDDVILIPGNRSPETGIR